ncbi:C2 domain-containing protein 2-like isoform x5 [Plakobranchus ocellatus]|uniref:C2 domain-containing protein 2-like isoform x5 n=1 Tax=Plakobranchus ocellatus TaxID=259542 RepID=A0AAV4DNQ5_9GAST|nr:C2 domain-containing protein 2-like isoform x5 [Plakobranchus ocellatus]
MADITLRLIWYKLGEVSGKMAEAGRTWYTELDFDSYVLDLLLFMWCAASIVVILVVNAIVSAFGPLQKQPKDWDSRGREPREGESLTGAVLPIESAKWFNNALNWFYLHYYYSPEFVEDWLKSLNEQLLRLGKVKILKARSGPCVMMHVSSSIRQSILGLNLPVLQQEETALPG